MKKIILTIAASLLLLPASFSQSLSLSTEEGSPISDGSTITVWGDLDNFMVAHVHVTNNSSVGINVQVARMQNTVITGSINYVCWDLCYDPSTDSTGILSLPAGTTNTDNFTADYAAFGTQGISNITYIFFDSENPTDNVSFNVNFYSSPTGINENNSPAVNVSKAYPNPASGSFAFDYSIPRNAGEVRVIVRDILGSVIHDINIGSGNGTLTLSALGMNEGIYFYTMYQGGKVLSTRKLVIK